jgi:hypothetical protein
MRQRPEIAHKSASRHVLRAVWDIGERSMQAQLEAELWRSVLMTKLTSESLAGDKQVAQIRHQ